MPDRTQGGACLFGPKQHAVMFGLLAREICRHFGPDADPLLLRAVETYGEERGRRMAERCRKNGDPLDDMASYFAYCEWSWPGESLRTENDPQCSHVSFRMLKCPLAGKRIGGFWLLLLPLRGPCNFEGIQSGATPESPLLPAQKSGRRLCLSLGKRGKHARSRRAAKAHPAASARHAGEGLPVPYGAPLQHVAALRGGNESTGGLPRRSAGRCGICTTLWQRCAPAGAGGSQRQLYGCISPGRWRWARIPLGRQTPAVYFVMRTSVFHGHAGHSGKGSIITAPTGFRLSGRKRFR